MSRSLRQRKAVNYADEKLIVDLDADEKQVKAALRASRTSLEKGTPEVQLSDSIEDSSSSEGENAAGAETGSKRKRAPRAESKKLDANAGSILRFTKPEKDIERTNKVEVDDTPPRRPQAKRYSVHNLS